MKNTINEARKAELLDLFNESTAPADGKPEQPPSMGDITVTKVKGPVVIGHSPTVTNTRLPQIDPNSPHAVRCPQCGDITGRYSELCDACTYRVRAHFDADEQAARQRRVPSTTRR